MKAHYFVNAMALITGVLLTGCANLNSKFDCPMKPGVMCENIDQVNTQVDQGTLGGNTATSRCKNCHSTKESTLTTASDFTTPYPLPAINPGDPIRYGETVMRVWMAPFEDKDGNYYQPTVLYTVIKPGSWIGQPIKAITEEGDNS